MNTSRSNGRGWLPGELWRRFQLWRAMRMLKRIPLLEAKGLTLKAEAQRLIRENSEPPAGPLFDGIDKTDQRG